MSRAGHILDQNQTGDGAEFFVDLLESVGGGKSNGTVRSESICDGCDKVTSSTVSKNKTIVLLP